MGRTQGSASLRGRFDRGSLLLVVLTALWGGTICFFSSQPAQVSSSCSAPFVRLAFMAAGVQRAEASGVGIVPLSEQRIVGLVRKSAHVLEYAVLSALLVFSLGRLGVRWPVPISIGLCTVFACLDELHQAFVPGRNPLMIDVLIDIASTAAAGLMAHLVRGAASRTART